MDAGRVLTITIVACAICQYYKQHEFEASANVYSQVMAIDEVSHAPRGSRAYLTTRDAGFVAGAARQLYRRDDGRGPGEGGSGDGGGARGARAATSARSSPHAASLRSPSLSR